MTDASALRGAEGNLHKQTDFAVQADRLRKTYDTCADPSRLFARFHWGFPRGSSPPSWGFPVQVSQSVTPAVGVGHPDQRARLDRRNRHHGDERLSAESAEIRTTRLRVSVVQPLAQSDCPKEHRTSDGPLGQVT